MAGPSATCVAPFLQQGDWVGAARLLDRGPQHRRYYLFWLPFLRVITLVQLLILANFDYFSAFISFDMSLKIPNRSARIVCNSPRWNQIGQVGDAPGVEVNS